MEGKKIDFDSFDIGLGGGWWAAVFRRGRGGNAPVT